MSYPLFMRTSIIICYRSGKQLNRIAALAGRNHLDGSNGSGCVLPVTTLNRLLHLLDSIAHLALGVAVLEIPACGQTKQQGDKRCSQCFHARSGLTRKAKPTPTSDVNRDSGTGDAIRLRSEATAGQVRLRSEAMTGQAGGWLWRFVSQLFILGYCSFANLIEMPNRAGPKGAGPYRVRPRAENQ